MMIYTKLGVLASVILLVTFIVVLVMRKGVVLGGSRRPRNRHAITRVICGLIGVGILVALAIGTSNHVDAIYAAGESAEKITLRLPAEATSSREPNEEGGDSEKQNTRALVHFVFAERTAAGYVPMHAEEIEVDWPRDRHEQIERRGSISDFSYELQLFVGGGTSTVPAGSTKFRLPIQVQYRIHAGTYTSSGTRNESLAVTTPLVIDTFHSWTKNALSVVQGPHDRYTLFGFLYLSARDDPLDEVSLASYATRVPFPEVDLENWRQPSYWSPEVPAYFRLIEDIELPAFLILIAAIFFAQMFARRGLAFAGMMCLCLLFTAVLDRVAVSAHASRLADTNLSPQIRHRAIDSLAETFFYRQTAVEAVTAAEADSANPPALRKSAHEAVRSLTDYENGTFLEPHFEMDFYIRPAEYQVVEKHDGVDGHFVIHVPSGQDELGLQPMVKLEIARRGRRFDSWHGHLYLSWKDGKLVPDERAKARIVVSDNLNAGKIEKTEEFEQVSDNVLRVNLQMTYTPNDRPDEPTHQDVSITVKIQPLDE